MHMSVSNMLLQMILYDENLHIYKSCGFISGFFCFMYMNRSKDEMLFMVVSWWMS